MAYSLLSNKYSNGYISEVMLFQVGRRANLQITLFYCIISWLLHVSTSPLGHTLFSVQNHVGCTGWTDAFNQFYKPYNFPVPKKKTNTSSADPSCLQALGSPHCSCCPSSHPWWFTPRSWRNSRICPFYLLLTKMNLTQQLVTQATKIFPFHMLGKQHLKGWFCIPSPCFLQTPLAVRATGSMHVFLQPEAHLQTWDLGIGAPLTHSLTHSDIPSLTAPLSGNIIYWAFFPLPYNIIAAQP